MTNPSDELCEIAIRERPLTIPQHLKLNDRLKKYIAVNVFWLTVPEDGEEIWKIALGRYEKWKKGKKEPCEQVDKFIQQGRIV